MEIADRSGEQGEKEVGKSKKFKSSNTKKIVKIDKIHMLF